MLNGNSLSGIHRRIMYRCVALLMLLVMAFLLPANHLLTKEVYAASQKKKYIKELKVFSKKDGEESDAQEWCDSQAENKDDDKDNNWYVVPGNLNEGAAGKMKSDISVFLCYRTTTDVSEAIRDIAVMNEQGNYSVGAYEVLLDEQRDYYIDLVNEMKTMIEEYRTNYNNRVPTTMNVYDFLNGFIDDDSGKRLGDLLLTVSDEDLAEILLQANGQVVIMLQEQLASACDTKKTTWLDRMESIGGYSKLKSRFLKAYNNNSAKANAALKTKYHEKALVLLDGWEDIRQHFDQLDAFVKKYSLDKMSEAEVEEWLLSKADTMEDAGLLDDYQAFLHNQQLLAILGAYTYEDGTLLDFFAQDKSAVSGENISKLYPLAECLSDGQFAGLEGSVSLYTFLMSATVSTVLDDNNSAKAAQIEKLTGEDAEEVEEAKDLIEGSIESWKEIEPISIYEGVDRGLFQGGVAVTSIAENYNTGDDSTWADSFVESGAFTKTAIGLGAGSILCAAGAIAAACGVKALYNTVINNSFIRLENIYTTNRIMFGAAESMRPITRDMITKVDFQYFTQYKDLVKYSTKLDAATKAQRLEQFQEIRADLFDNGFSNNVKGVGMYKFLNGLKIGLAVFAILLAIADITMTIITLVKYYNRSHLSIPKYMVDLSYDEDKEATFVPYKGVLDTGGKNQGDLNGGGGKQWLAIFASTDEGAGDPIYAPDGDLHEIIVKKKDHVAPVGYSPLHLFGVPGSAQNLTYADGEDGWSFNDKAGGIYLFFERDANWKVDLDAPATGTSFSTGRAVLFGGSGIVIGLVLGIFGTLLVKRKKKAVAK